MTDIIERLKLALAARYTIERVLGRGGMATVYLGEDLKHRRKVAVKVLQPELSQAIGADRFLKEIEVTANLTHPNILPLHDSGEAGGLLYYVMPYVEGESLRQRLNREKQLPLEAAVRIVQEVAGALAYAHSHGVVHRDIKPENVLLQSDHAVVADFGIARAIDAGGGERLTETGLALGTPSYMSPEQAAGEAVDARTDVYALGCVLYELLAGEPPYGGPNPRSVLAKTLADPVPSVRRLRSTVPVGVEHALTRALAKVPADRFATATQFSDALGRALAEPSASVVPSTRVRRALVPAIVAGLVLSGGAWWFGARLGWFGVAPPDSIAVLPFQNLSHDAAQEEYLVEGMHDALISELAGISSLRVISRTSTMRFRGTTKSVGEIARELGVGAVVETSVLRVGDSVHVQVQLIQARPQERRLWGQTYDRDARTVLAIPREVALAIARQSNVGSTPRRAVTAAPRDADPLAYEDYLRGREVLRQGGGAAGLKDALQLFEAAVRRDSTFARAYIAAAAIWSARAGLGVLSADSAFRRAEPFIARAFALDSTSSEVRLARASIREWQWNWAGADREYRAAIQSDSNDANALGTYARFLVAQGLAGEAMPHMTKALVLDPLNPERHTQYGNVLSFQHRYDEALDHYRVTLKLAPNHLRVHWDIWAVFNAQRKFTDALAEASAFFERNGEPAVVAALKGGNTEGGYAVAMRRAADLLAQQARTRFVRPFWLVALYARAGEIELALDWLEKAVEARDPNMNNLRVMNVADPLREHPRYTALVRRMNLDRALEH